MWYCTTIIWKHESSVSLVSNQYINMLGKHIYIQFSWCLPHKKIVYEKCMTWTYSLYFAFYVTYIFCCTSCFKVEIYPVFSSRVEFILGICPILNLMTTIVLKECILQLKCNLLWVRPPPFKFKHPIWLWRFPKGYKNMRISYFPALATSPSHYLMVKK
jgi:hypothetical protein